MQESRPDPILPKGMPSSATIGSITSGTHIRGLDGLRGVAVLAVIGFHLANYASPGSELGFAIRDLFRLGWVGVDLFFVLSGFLITGILYDNRHRRGRIPAFYGRRIVRIMPLYFAVLAAYAVALPIFGSPADVRALADVMPWHATWLTNVRVADAQSWVAAPLMTSHLWSLSVEEQFYLVWPALLGACSLLVRRGSSFGWDDRRMMMTVCFVLVAISVATRTLVLHSEPLAAYVLLPARMDALAVGAFIALWIRGPRGVAPALQVSAPVLIGVLIVALYVVGFTLGPASYLDPLKQKVGYTLWAVLFGAVILQVVGHPDGPFARLLGRSWLARTGRISYGLYLIHYPVIFVLSHLGVADAGFPLFVVATLLVTYALSILSWHCIESPALRLKRYFPYGGTLDAPALKT